MAQGKRSFGAIRKLPSKRYQASYIGPDLARHNAPGTFTSKADAEAWVALERRLRTEPAVGRLALARAEGCA